MSEILLLSRDQLGLKYEGQLNFMAEPIPILPTPRTPSRHSLLLTVDWRAETDRY